MIEITRTVKCDFCGKEIGGNDRHSYPKLKFDSVSSINDAERTHILALDVCKPCAAVICEHLINVCHVEKTIDKLHGIQPEKDVLEDQNQDNTQTENDRDPSIMNISDLE